MLIKKAGHPKTVLNRFDLLGDDEKALSKAFAFLLASEPVALFDFLRYLGIRIKNTKENFKNISIVTEYNRKEGRIDIETKYDEWFQIFIESKVRKNKVLHQRTQYLNSFDPNIPEKFLCFITQERDHNKQKAEGIIIHYVGWEDINLIFDTKYWLTKPLMKEYLSFSIKNYNMKYQKEILIQDLSEPNEIKRFKEFNVYRRPETLGSPLYFAPHFTNYANQEEGVGIPYLSKILGILTLKASDIENFETDIKNFTTNTPLVNDWIKGVKLGSDNETFTYFFLDKPLKLTKNLQKDGGRKQGRGKDWIAAMIPANRCVTFSEFTKRLMQNN
jgi:hypothetical protein